MSEGAAGGYGDEDRLPWLETVDDEYSEGPSLWRILLLVMLGLAVLSAAIFGFYWYQRNAGLAGTGALINAQEGDYKIKPDQPGGMQVEGRGDTRFTASEGGLTNAQVALDSLPEAPVEGRTVATPSPAAAGGRVVRAPVPASPLPAATPSAAPANSGGGGAIVQLGSFPSEAEANAAWGRLAGRFGYLAALGKSIAPGEVRGRPVHRLRVNAGSATQARELCARLAAAGEGCFVAN